MPAHRIVTFLLVLMLVPTLLAPQQALSQADDFGSRDLGGLAANQALTGATVLASAGKLTARGAAVSLPVKVSNVQKLGATTIRVGFDPAVLKALGCQRSALFDVGFCNPNHDSDGDGKADAVLFNALSLTGVSAGTTPVDVTNISWQAVGTVTRDTLTTLTVEVRTFTNVDGNPMPQTAQDGVLVIHPASPRLFLPLLRR